MKIKEKRREEEKQKMKLVKTFTLLPEIRQLFDLTLEIELKKNFYYYRWSDRIFRPAESRQEIALDFEFPIPKELDCILQESNKVFWKSNAKKTIHFYKVALNDEPYGSYWASTNTIIDSESPFYMKGDTILFFIRKDDTIRGGNLEFTFEEDFEPDECLTIQESSAVVINRTQKFKITPCHGNGVFSFIVVKFFEE